MFFLFFYFPLTNPTRGPGALSLLSICLLIFFFFSSLLPGPANPIRMQHLSPLISPQKLMVSQLVSCLSDNMDLEYQPVCNNEGWPRRFHLTSDASCWPCLAALPGEISREQLSLSMYRLPAHSRPGLHSP